MTSPSRSPRGVETALRIWGKVEKGALISEQLRALADSVSPPDRTLAASLCYAMARRLSLWQHLRALFMLPKPSKFTRVAQTAVLCGACGLMELENFAPAALISALIDWTKVRDPRGARVVNAVLRRVLEEGPAELERLKNDGSLTSRCLLCGVPKWAALEWQKDYGKETANRLVEMTAIPPCLSLRLSPHAPHTIDRIFEDEGILFSESPIRAWHMYSSPSLDRGGLRVHGTPLPSSLPGYEEGYFTPQSESSMEVGSYAASFVGDYLLDMCAGRGVKTGQIVQLNPDATVEAWDLSPGRVAAGKREMERLCVSERVHYKCGDALELMPDRTPGVILVDAPCSGSGTWRRHPESKWRQSHEEIVELSGLQKRLLERAFALVPRGGVVIYSTCSLFACENERVTQEALSRNPQMRPLPEIGPEIGSPHLHNSVPRTLGSVIMPTNPWTDGFYLAVFEKQTDNGGTQL